FERARVAALGPHLWIEAGNGLDVVVEDVGTGAHHGGERGLVAHEVGDQHLDVAFRNALADLPDGPREDGRAAVLELVPVDRSKAGVMQSRALAPRGPRNRPARADHARPPGLDGAEAASA